MGLNDALAQSRRELPDWVRTISQIPVIGPWVEQVGILVGLVTEARDAAAEMEVRARGDEEARQQVAASARERGAREAFMSAEREHMSSLRELASAMYIEGVQGEEAISGALMMRHDMTSEQASELASQLAGYQREGGAGYTTAHMGDLTGWMRNIGVLPIARAFGYSPERAASEHMFEQAMARQAEMGRAEFQMETPEERALRRGEQPLLVPGRMATSPLAELEQLLGTGLGPPAAQTVASTAEGRQEVDVTVQPTQLEVLFNIPVEVDGREVGRAVGRHVQEINERRGTAEIGPGSRRRSAEQGVP
jgi:hypothetical protein